MALLTVSGEPYSRFEETAHGAAQLLSFELITRARIDQWLADEYGEAPLPDHAWRPAVASILARLTKEHHLVIALPGAEALFDPLPLLLRAGIVASENRRAGNLMLDQRLERPAAKAELARLDKDARHQHKERFGRYPLSPVVPQCSLPSPRGPQSRLLRNVSLKS